ncbi:MAG: thiamine biosynthesis lipoprotein [Limisphaerales bacterium]|jgi:thiamine biosynthesis lipoprotein
MSNDTKTPQCGALWILMLTLFLQGCESIPESEVQRFEFQRMEMGLMFRMALHAPDEAAAKSAAKAAFDRIRELNSILSDYEDDSELNQVRHSSGSGRWIKVSPELWKVMRAADRFSRDSGGAFDVTAGPLIQLWKRARRQRALPAPDRLAEARTRVGHYYIGFRTKDRSLVLWRQGIRLDLGGIAKGYAMDEAMRVLEAHGIRSALISGGGDLVASAAPPGKPAWKIELPTLSGGGAPRFVALVNAAFATSGDRFQFVLLDGKRYSHIVDARSGQALSDRALVYVVAPSGMIADALATSASVLTGDEAVQLAKKNGALISVTRERENNRIRSESIGFESRLWPVD